jgi:hypothetical protein
MSCKIVKNKGVYTIESGVKYQSSGRSAARKSIKSTIFKGLTFKLIYDRIRVLLTQKRGLQIYDII